jgi:hypothetical protein
VAKTSGPAKVNVREDDAPLRIGELRLCSKVSGYGSFEPLSESTVKAGQRLLVYCEMTGLRYEAKGAEFLSRLSSRLEIRSARDGAIAWEHELGAAEDVCRHRRRDYYVNYRIELPKSLPPGSYALRVIQNDLVAGRFISAEIPLAVAP